VTEFSFLLLQVHYPHICTVGTEQFVEWMNEWMGPISSKLLLPLLKVG
jgi:hypothetical protein